MTQVKQKKIKFLFLALTLIAGYLLLTQKLHQNSGKLPAERLASGNDATCLMHSYQANEGIFLTDFSDPNRKKEVFSFNYLVDLIHLDPSPDVSSILMKVHLKDQSALVVKADFQGLALKQIHSTEVLDDFLSEVVRSIALKLLPVRSMADLKNAIAATNAVQNLPKTSFSENTSAVSFQSELRPVNSQMVTGSRQYRLQPADPRKPSQLVKFVERYQLTDAGLRIDGQEMSFSQSKQQTATSVFGEKRYRFEQLSARTESDDCHQWMDLHFSHQIFLDPDYASAESIQPSRRKIANGEVKDHIHSLLQNLDRRRKDEISENDLLVEMSFLVGRLRDSNIRDLLPLEDMLADLWETDRDQADFLLDIIASVGTETFQDFAFHLIRSNNLDDEAMVRLQQTLIGSEFVKDEYVDALMENLDFTLTTDKDIVTLLLLGDYSSKASAASHENFLHLVRSGLEQAFAEQDRLKIIQLIRTLSIYRIRRRYT
ncbi:MAG: hypothetical protein ACOH5I_21180 [Oligoflexus sp.]